MPKIKECSLDQLKKYEQLYSQRLAISPDHEDWIKALDAIRRQIEKLQAGDQTNITSSMNNMELTKSLSVEAANKELGLKSKDKDDDSKAKTSTKTSTKTKSVGLIKKTSTQGDQDRLELVSNKKKQSFENHKPSIPPHNSSKWKLSKVSLLSILLAFGSFGYVMFEYGRHDSLDELDPMALMELSFKFKKNKKKKGMTGQSHFVASVEDRDFGLLSKKVLSSMGPVIDTRFKEAFKYVNLMLGQKPQYDLQLRPDQETHLEIFINGEYLSRVDVIPSFEDLDTALLNYAQKELKKNSIDQKTVSDPKEAFSLDELEKSLHFLSLPQMMKFWDIFFKKIQDKKATSTDYYQMGRIASRMLLTVPFPSKTLDEIQSFAWAALSLAEADGLNVSKEKILLSYNLGHKRDAQVMISSLREETKKEFEKIIGIINLQEQFRQNPSIDLAKDPLFQSIIKDNLLSSPNWNWSYVPYLILFQGWNASNSTGLEEYIHMMISKILANANKEEVISELMAPKDIINFLGQLASDDSSEMIKSSATLAALKTRLLNVGHKQIKMELDQLKISQNEKNNKEQLEHFLYSSGDLSHLLGMSWYMQSYHSLIKTKGGGDVSRTSRAGEHFLQEYHQKLDDALRESEVKEIQKMAQWSKVLKSDTIDENINFDLKTYWVIDSQLYQKYKSKYPEKAVPKALWDTRNDDLVALLSHGDRVPLFLKRLIYLHKGHSLSHFDPVKYSNFLLESGDIEKVIGEIRSKDVHLLLKIQHLKGLRRFINKNIMVTSSSLKNLFELVLASGQVPFDLILEYAKHLYFSNIYDRTSNRYLEEFVTSKEFKKVTNNIRKDFLYFWFFLQFKYSSPEKGCDLQNKYLDNDQTKILASVCQFLGGNRSQVLAYLKRLDSKVLSSYENIMKIIIFVAASEEESADELIQKSGMNFKNALTGERFIFFEHVIKGFKENQKVIKMINYLLDRKILPEYEISNLILTLPLKDKDWLSSALMANPQIKFDHNQFLLDLFHDHRELLSNNKLWLQRKTQGMNKTARFEFIDYALKQGEFSLLWDFLSPSLGDIENITFIWHIRNLTSDYYLNHFSSDLNIQDQLHGRFKRLGDENLEDVYAKYFSDLLDDKKFSDLLTQAAPDQEQLKSLFAMLSLDSFSQMDLKKATFYYQAILSLPETKTAQGQDLEKSFFIQVMPILKNLLEKRFP